LDPIGLHDKIVKSAADIDLGRKWLDTEGLEAAGRISYRGGLALALEAFQEAQILSSGNLEAIVLVEYTFLVQEFQVCASADTKSMASLTRAIESFDDALLALKAVMAGPSYGVAEQIFPRRGKAYRYKGMPKDAFHVACSGHKTRIINILRSPGINLNEKALLEQRFSNMIIAQSVYVEKQKEVITVDVE
jgi:hypothetical protein